MIVVDTNILVYAHRKDLADHAAAAAAVRRLAEGRASWGIPWACVHEFLSVVTDGRIFVVPSPAEAAVEQVEVWMESPGLKMLCETAGYWDALKRTVLGGRLKGAQVHDARIHAICVSHGVEELWSADRDFTRMRGVRVVNPCVG
ncbi:MAG: type II toxin-antitoxin system VapC family toxin [Acidobacteria bacterium]|nr:type II toxin-antitoxin system VapC family toxin [Acidobacteriota bacterium]